MYTQVADKPWDRPSNQNPEVRILSPVLSRGTDGKTKLICSNEEILMCFVFYTIAAHEFLVMLQVHGICGERANGAICHY